MKKFVFTIFVAISLVIISSCDFFDQKSLKVSGEHFFLKNITFIAEKESSLIEFEFYYDCDLSSYDIFVAFPDFLINEKFNFNAENKRNTITKSSVRIPQVITSLEKMTYCFEGIAAKAKEPTFDVIGYNSVNDCTIDLSLDFNEMKINDLPYATFMGFYFDPFFEKPIIDLKRPPYNFTIYAKWEINKESLVTCLETSVFKGNVEIKTVNNNYISREEKIGSGFIFKETLNYYYVITNNHVCYQGSFFNQQIKVIDLYGTYYNATNVYSDPNYDLAILRINKRANLDIIPFYQEELFYNTSCIAVGNPNGNKRTVTFGYIEEYTEAYLIDTSTAESNIQFFVIKHSAEIDNGSSGGMLLGLNLDLIGVNYAGSENENQFKYGLAIPLEKVYECLEKVKFIE